MCNDCDETPCPDCEDCTDPNDPNCEPKLTIPVNLGSVPDTNPCAADWRTLVEQNASGRGTGIDNSSTYPGSGSGGGGGDTGPGGNGTTTTFFSAALSVTKRKNNCPSGQRGQDYQVNLPAGSITSTLSQADANARAKSWLDNVAQLQANQFGTCTAVIVITATFSALNWVGDLDCDQVVTFTSITWGWLSGTIETGCL